VLNEYDQFTGNLEGYIVHPFHEQNAFKGIYGDWYGRVQGNTLNGAVQFPQGIGVTEKPGKQTVFILRIYTHRYYLVYCKISNKSTRAGEPHPAHIGVIGDYSPAVPGFKLEEARHVVYGPDVKFYPVGFAVRDNLIVEEVNIGVVKLQAAALDIITGVADMFFG
jgi:hypothetical protein